jgi:hypothetical protein
MCRLAGERLGMTRFGTSIRFPDCEVDEHVGIGGLDDLGHSSRIRCIDEVEGAPVQPTARRIRIETRDRFHPGFALQPGGNE